MHVALIMVRLHLFQMQCAFMAADVLSTCPAVA